MLIFTIIQIEMYTQRGTEFQKKIILARTKILGLSLDPLSSQ